MRSFPRNRARQDQEDVRASEWAASLLPHEGPDQLELAMRRRLMLSLSKRGSTEAGVLVIPGVLCWMYGRSAGYHALWAWWACFVIATLGIVWLRRSFGRDQALPDAASVMHWERVFHRAAPVMGGFWAAPLVLTLQGGSTDFKLFLYMVLCAVVASSATYLAPLPGLFWRFFAAIYVPMVVAVYWVFPLRWMYLMPLVLLYGAVIVRHAMGGRRLLVQQIEHERQRQRLAERYRLAKEEAERALAERNRFISTTSHDLRQPLHAMGLLLEAALQRNADAQLAPVLHDVRDCVRSLNFMFNALLDLSRLESGEFTARREDVSLAAVFDDVATVFRPDAAQRGLRLKTFLPRGRAPWVRADPALLRQMVFNLTQNALRYTQSGGLLLGVRLRGRQWRVEVWDTGAGVDPQDRERIYAPYARGGAGRRQDVEGRGLEGHGLGLAVVARCARLTGAEYGFDSTPGRGSCFWLQMPVAAVPSPSPVTPAGPLALPRAASLSGTCLLVDDDPQVGSALRRLLQSWGVQVQVSPSGAHALARLKRGFVPDAILCDYRLSAAESGLAVLQALQARCGHTRGAMLTGEHAAPELLQAEEDGYLVLRKPLEPAVLHALLARWLPAAGRALPPA
ncbi:MULTISPECIES: hybrid sensor histidine kinase/response regulator [unclassified Acidovorax]|uniref:ATP-binding response regulator n=1 Tax=unclassified Acidovorax TaxID=2684926 RepID=UPI0028832664|nr:MULTISPECIES: hybrid sensor histidine kinase/response regulator [unclassified Acidovorax]